MRNEKKIIYQRKRIVELENKVKELEQENLNLENQLETNKNTVLLREQALNQRETYLKKTQKEFDGMIAEVDKIKVNYENAIKEIKLLFAKYSKDAKKEIKRIRHQK